MRHDDIAMRAEHDAAWRLLRARNAPLVLAFLGEMFVEENHGPVPATQVLGRLDDLLYALNTVREESDCYSGTPAGYLDAWCAPEAGWLRRFYPDGAEEVHYDATPPLEKAYAWVRSLGPRPFVGTESRLDSLVQLLRQMVHGSEVDPDVRLAELHRRRADIDREIAEVEAGNVSVLDDVALRERYHLFTSTARDLLSDFREVEENFRGLDRDARERIATWEAGKGELLERLVGDRSDIANSDQGRSFGAFYDFLLSGARQEELSDLLDRVQRLDGVVADPRMRTVHHEWSDAAERTQATVRQLSEQLRRFLDDQVWLENRRVLDLTRRIEGHALALRGARPDVGLEIDLPGVEIVLPFDRPLYDVRPATVVDSRIEMGDATDLDTTALFEQTYVDSARLAKIVRSVVPARGTARLDDVLELYPVQDGLAEIVGYLALADDDLSVDIATDTEERITIEFQDRDGRPRAVRLAPVTISRTEGGRTESAGRP